MVATKAAARVTPASLGDALTMDYVTTKMIHPVGAFAALGLHSASPLISARTAEQTRLEMMSLSRTRRVLFRVPNKLK